LLDAGADLKARKKDDDYTPPISTLLVQLIKLAIQKGIGAMNDNLKVIDLFLAAGAKKWAKDGNRLTPVKHAISVTSTCVEVRLSSDRKTATNRYEAAKKRLREYYNSLPGGPEPRKSYNEWYYDFW